MSLDSTLSLVYSGAIPNNTVSRLVRFLLPAGLLCQYFGGTPSKNNTTPKFAKRYSGAFRPFGKRQGLAVICKKMVVSFIQVLHITSHPLTVFGRIVAIIINSLKSHVGGTFAHILKIITNIVPTITNCDTPTAVIVKRLMSGIITSLHHCSPSLVSSRFDHSVPAISCTQYAAAAGGFPMTQVIASHISNGSTVTLANIVNAGGFADFRPSQNRPLTKAFPGQIIKSRHQDILPQNPVFMGAKS